MCVCSAALEKKFLKKNHVLGGKKQKNLFETKVDSIDDDDDDDDDGE